MQASKLSSTLCSALILCCGVVSGAAQAATVVFTNDTGKSETDFEFMVRLHETQLPTSIPWGLPKVTGTAPDYTVVYTGAAIAPGGTLTLSDITRDTLVYTDGGVDFHWTPDGANFVPPVVLPLPASLPMLGASLVALGAWGWDRSRRSKAV